MDSLDWRKKYEVLSISRLSLGSLGFSTEQINSLTDDDLQRIAEKMENDYRDHGFEDDLKFLVRLELAEKPAACTTDLWNNAFQISGVTREDLVQAGFPKEVVEKLSDIEMHEIAAAMADVYCDNGYWEDLELCTNRVLKSKEEEPTA